METIFDGRPLSEFLRRDRNAFNLVRLLAAAGVMYGHAFALFKPGQSRDLIHEMTGFYAGDLGVKSFFLLSGLLVTNSLLQNRDPLAFVIHRFFRIWPALIVVVLFSAYLIGPLFTSYSLWDYLTDTQTWRYVRKMVSLNSFGTQGLGYYNLPGLFSENTFKDTVNAPLWTIAIEVYAYVMILALFLIGVLNRRAAGFVFAAIVVDGLLPARVLFFWLPANSLDLSYLPFCFAVGGLAAIFKDELRVNVSAIGGFLLIFYLFRGSSFSYECFYIFLFLGILFVATRTQVVNMSPKTDISYGLYLWGWPVQQIIAQQFPDMNFLVCQFGSILIAAVFGYLSWVLVERRSIKLGIWLSQVIRFAPMREAGSRGLSDTKAVN